jgi:L-asparaginase II
MTQPTFWQIAATNETALVAALSDLLRGSGWQTAKQLARHGFNDRTLRAIASASHGQIISGQRGYALITEATVDEANHAAHWLEHQAKAMLARAYDIRRAMHQRGAA